VTTNNSCVEGIDFKASLGVMIQGYTQPALTDVEITIFSGNFKATTFTSN
jgi:hypothetical protein